VKITHLARNSRAGNRPAAQRRSDFLANGPLSELAQIMRSTNIGRKTVGEIREVSCEWNRQKERAAAHWSPPAAWLATKPLCGPLASVVAAAAAPPSASAQWVAGFAGGVGAGMLFAAWTGNSGFVATTPPAVSRPCPPRTRHHRPPTFWFRLCLTVTHPGRPPHLPSPAWPAP